MNAYQAQRIRFGILARDVMTPDQIDYLEGCEAAGWIVGDGGTAKAFDRESLRLAAPRKVRPERARHG